MAVAAILAGGTGRRLGGRDKSALRTGNGTILTRQVATLAPVVDRVLIVGYRGSQALPPEVTVVLDRVSGAGPLAGLDTALSEADTDDVLLVACDMPNVSPALARHLLARCRDSGVNAVVPRTDRGYHPLYAVYSASCRDVVRDRLARGALRMIDLLGELRVWTVEGQELAQFGDAAHLLANVNTAADLAALEALQNH